MSKEVILNFNDLNFNRPLKQPFNMNRIAQKASAVLIIPTFQYAELYMTYYLDKYSYERLIHTSEDL